ncbi:MAG TPA: glycoside hydrolase family 16 protein [Vicinamibacterales bacterium]
MKRTVLACAVFALLAAPRTPVSADKTIFFEDFSGAALDRTKWNVIVTGRTVNQEQQAYVDSPETIALRSDAEGAQRGALSITARRHPGFRTPEGRAFDFVSGRIDTRGKFQFTYGTAEARIRLTAGAGLWPAFWALGTGRWPDTGEMDILENVGDPAWTNFAVHGPGYAGDKCFDFRQRFHGGGDITGWHVYGMTWTPDAMIFAVDGHERWRVDRATVETRGGWAFDTPKFLIVNQAIGGTYPHAVNHAETPFLGLPQSTVDTIAAGRAVMLVDWIRVTTSQS